MGGWWWGGGGGQGGCKPRIEVMKPVIVKMQKRSERGSGRRVGVRSGVKRIEVIVKVQNKVGVRGYGGVCLEGW